MSTRLVFYTVCLAGVLAGATLAAAPHRPNLVALPADWSPLPKVQIAAFPFGAAYAGDRVSVSAYTAADLSGKTAVIRLDTPAGAPLASQKFFYNGTGADWQIQLPWIWDSTGRAGWHTLFVAVAGDPAQSFLVPLRILPAADRPAQRRQAAWKSAASACCDYYYLSDTESERDLSTLIKEAEQIYQGLNARMGGISPRPALVFLPRLYGQGGVTIQEAIVSYLDRNFTGTDPRVILEHEMVHAFAAAQFPTGARPPILLQEGWAVYLTGGHYRSPEPLQEHAAVLVQQGRYLPLADLADEFSSIQHEAAYIEAGAFVEYLAQRFGDDRVLKMYLDPPANPSPGAALDAMLRNQFGRSLAELENDWRTFLAAVAPEPDGAREVDFTLALFDSIRRYELLYDPGSAMADLWLPDPAGARSERITADYLPSPATVEAIALETLFRAAGDAADAGDWARAGDLLAAAGRVLDAKARRVPEPLTAAPAADAFGAIVRAVLRAGGEPLSIDLESGRAEVEVRNPANLAKEVQRWNLSRGSWARAG